MKQMAFLFIMLCLLIMAPSAVAWESAVHAKGVQDICKAFGFTIPDGCAPVYVSKAKPVTRRRGRPANPKVENQEL